MSSLFEKIGGRDAVNAAVDLFYKKVLADDRINGFFEGIDMDAQKIPATVITGFLGAGKTTLIRIITQIIAADSGSILMHNRPLSIDHVREMVLIFCLKCRFYC